MFFNVMPLVTLFMCQKPVSSTQINQRLINNLSTNTPGS